jgi:hypothetical protein
LAVLKLRKGAIRRESNVTENIKRDMIKGKIERKGVRLMLIWEENKEKSASKSKHKKSRGGHFGKGEEGEIFFLDQN